jgi:hypothetical protein
MARRRFDDWGRPRAIFSFRDLEQAADAASVPPRGTVVDPFAGCGSAGTFLTARGETFIGIEAHRLIGELASLKGARVGSPRFALVPLWAIQDSNLGPLPYQRSALTI